MTRTVKVLGGVVTAVAVAILLAYAYLSQGVSTTPSVTYSGSYETIGPGGSSPVAGRTPTCVLPSAGHDELAWVCLVDLPKQAQQTVALIDVGGPFPYAKDGATFNNFERLLPNEPKGYYREYTVKTPGEGDRGARRIVTGDHDRELFYTDDHYETFVRVQR